MTDRIVFLVYGFEVYECPCDPIKAFTSETDARALLTEIAAYQNTKPMFPGNDASDDEYDKWSEANEKWHKAHPAGDASYREGFSVMPLALVEHKPCPQGDKEQ